MGVWAIVVAILLLIPFLLMRFDIKLYDPGSGYEEMNWTAFDFVFAGVLLFGSAAFYEFLTRKMLEPKKRFLVGLGVFLVLALVWGMAATG